MLDADRPGGTRFLRTLGCDFARVDQRVLDTAVLQGLSGTVRGEPLRNAIQGDFASSAEKHGGRRDLNLPPIHAGKRAG